MSEITLPKTSTCKIEDCDQPKRGRGWCPKHYQRWKNNGGPLVILNNVSVPFYLPDGTVAHKSPIYKTWESIKQRCNKPYSTYYSKYGGRGIKMCERWQNSFEAFYNDVGDCPSENHSLDRIDNSGNYEPGNLRWATKSIQAYNQGIRTTNKSGYRGVFERKNGRWVANIWQNWANYRLGTFDNPEDAALAYDVASIQLYGSDAQTNILEVSS